MWRVRRASACERAVTTKTKMHYRDHIRRNRAGCKADLSELLFYKINQQLLTNQVQQGCGIMNNNCVQESEVKHSVNSYRSST